MSINEPVIAIVGASGLTGAEILNILEERNFPFSDLKLFASKDSAGEQISVAGEEYEIYEISEGSFAETDIAIFTAPLEIASKYVPIALEAGCRVIDLSDKFRNEKEVPLVCSQVNLNIIKSTDRLISIPDQLTLQLAPIIKLIHQAAQVKKLDISTYQAVSGAGRVAMDELWDQTKAVYSQKEVLVEAFPHQISFNCIPHIDLFSENGYTREELKVINETARLFSDSSFKINCSCVRVPVFNCNAMTVSLETERELSAEDAVRLLQQEKGFEVFAGSSDYSLQIDLSGRDEISIGRIRKNTSVTFGLTFWTVCDNLRLAAVNAVAIAEHLIRL